MNRLSPRASGQTAPLLLHILSLTVLTRWAAVRHARSSRRRARKGRERCHYLWTNLGEWGEDAKGVTPAFLTAACREHGAQEFGRRPASRWGDRRVTQTRV